MQGAMTISVYKRTADACFHDTSRRFYAYACSEGGQNNGPTFWLLAHKYLRQVVGTLENNECS